MDIFMFYILLIFNVSFSFITNLVDYATKCLAVQDVNEVSKKTKVL